MNTYPSHFVTAKHNFLTLRFEKASSAHEAAKEMVTLAEEGFVEKGMHFDAAWQEMLNHATNRVSGRGNEEGEMTKFVDHFYSFCQIRILRMKNFPIPHAESCTPFRLFLVHIS